MESTGSSSANLLLFTVGALRSRWMWRMGSLVEVVPHDPCVRVAPADCEDSSECMFLTSPAAVEAFVARLRAAADRAWPARSDGSSREPGS